MNLCKLTKPLGLAIAILATAGLAHIHAADLLVSSTNTSEVLRRDGTTGSLSVFAAGDELSLPVGLAFGPDGNLYVASLGTGQVLRYSGTTGAFMDVFVSAGELLEPNGMVFGPDGNLYVSDRSSGQVLRYSGTTGVFVDVFASGGGLSDPLGLTFGPGGHLYVSSGLSHQVLRYDGTSGAFLGVFASDGGLKGPAGLVFGSDGNLYVSSQVDGGVLRYNGTTGAFIDVFASGGGLAMPYGLAFGPAGDLYVSSAANNQVLRYNGTTGAFVDVFAEGGLDFPTYLAFTPSSPPVPLVIEVPVDVKPGVCPNLLNVASRQIPVAILGTSTFDVTRVDAATVKLAGASPVRGAALDDVGTPALPFTGKSGAGDCNAEGPDGFADLVLHFDIREIVSAMGPVTDGEVKVLPLTGNLQAAFGGTPIQGEDVVVIKKR